ncbi:tropomyosin-2, variant 2 [Basidiobolus ranarum]|uniref:Tropomyosin-2, variant 2 n=1 Tax=Basidiobolus ranarum TaxID=34480 RepID=A0ABR2W2S9_9FUNG
MERLKERINTLRAEADAASARAEQAEAQLKKLIETQLDREQETLSFQKKIQLLEEQLEKAEQKLVESKASNEETQDHRSLNDNLGKKLSMVEEKLEETENKLKETIERLREIDLKAEQSERKVQQLESEKVTLENKFVSSMLLSFSIGCILISSLHE